MKKKIPTLRSDQEAEAFLEQAELTEYDPSGLTRVRFPAPYADA